MSNVTVDCSASMAGACDNSSAMPSSPLELVNSSTPMISSAQLDAGLTSLSNRPLRESCD